MKLMAMATRMAISEIVNILFLFELEYGLTLSPSNAGANETEIGIPFFNFSFLIIGF
jgi:hypothetical protein